MRVRRRCKPCSSMYSSTACRGSQPAPVVVQDEHPARRQAGVEVHELVSRGLVPVGVQAQDCYLLRRLLWDGVLDETLHESDAIGG